MSPNQRIGNDPCPICQTPYGQPNDNGEIEEPASLACGHVLGHDCSRRWLETADASRTCPICRFPLTYTTCNHIIRARLRATAPPQLTSPDERPAFCPDACDDFIRSLFDGEKVWERSQQNGVWLLGALQHSEEDVKKIVEQIDFALQRKEEFRRSLRARFVKYLDTDFDARW